LAEVYAGRSDGDPAPLFLELCRSRRDDIAALLATGQTQTNKCVLASLSGETSAVVLTTWAYVYLSVDAREEFVEVLATDRKQRPVAWLSAEGAGSVAALGPPEAAADAPGAVVLDHRLRRVERLGARASTRRVDRLAGAVAGLTAPSPGP
jgi:hypothetical protein